MKTLSHWSLKHLGYYSCDFQTKYLFNTSMEQRTIIIAGCGVYRSLSLLPLLLLLRLLMVANGNSCFSMCDSEVELVFYHRIHWMKTTEDNDDRHSLKNVCGIIIHMWCLLTDANDSDRWWCWWYGRCCCWCRCTRDCNARWILKFKVLLSRWLAAQLLCALPALIRAYTLTHTLTLSQKENETLSSRSFFVHTTKG